MKYFIPLFLFISSSFAANFEIHQAVKRQPLFATVSPSSVSIELKKEHRILDTIARLLIQELRRNGIDLGSVSIALIREDGIDKLAVAFKRYPIECEDTEWFFQALNNLLYYSINSWNEEEYISAEKRNFRIAMYYLNYPMKNSWASYQKLVARQNIDKTKFKKFLLMDFRTLPGNDICRRIQKIFVEKYLNERGRLIISANKLDAENILLVNNLPVKKNISYHSEIALAEYLLDNRLYLGHLETDNSIKPYQYIGSSFKMCSMCNAVIRGRISKDGNLLIKGYNQHPDIPLLIFLRGNYDFFYPKYLITKRTRELNPCELFILEYNLRYSSKPSNSVQLGKIIIEQSVDISDTDEEE